MKNFHSLPALLPVLLLSSCSGIRWPGGGESLSIRAFKALQDTSARCSLSAEIVSVENSSKGCIYVWDSDDYLYVYGMSPAEGLKAGDCIGFSARKGVFNGRAEAREAELIWRREGAYPGTALRQPEADWLELPTAQPEENIVFLCHKGLSGCRNFSVLYDTSAHLARWVCYPLASGDVGAGRSGAYAFDPLLEESLQADLNKSFQNRKKGGEEFIRGHLVPSYERSGRENLDVFLATNIIPQSSALNGGVWSALENAERSWAAACDTLYVVVGTILSGSTYTVSDNSSPRRKVPVPAAVYRVFLARLRDGSFKGLAALFQNKAYSSKSFSSDMAMSIDELEGITGLDFFSNLPSRIEEAVESADPRQDSWWWSLN